MRWFIAALLLAGGAHGAEATVDIELVTEKGAPLDAPRAWLEAMKGIPNTGLRIRTGGDSERELVENRGTEVSPRYHVVGVLTSRNRLRLPGGEFPLQNRAAIAKWFERLRTEGIVQPGAERVAFGLTSEQLVRLHEQLSAPIDYSTKDQRAGDVTRRLVKSLGIPFEVTEEARAAFARNETVPDELQGLSSGTALAALLRPLGLVFAPKRAASRDAQLVIADLRQVEQFWPVGWPLEQPPGQVSPPLYEHLNVEIKDTALSEALAAIQGRVKIPFLYDHNGLARLDVDLNNVKVSFPKGRTLYKKIIDQILFQAHLSSELRVDEAGNPFLWISSVVK